MLQQLRSRDEGIAKYALRGDASGPATCSVAHTFWPPRLQGNPSTWILPTELSAWAQLSILSAVRTAGLEAFVWTFSSLVRGCPTERGVRLADARALVSFNEGSQNPQTVVHQVLVRAAKQSTMHVGPRTVVLGTMLMRLESLLAFVGLCGVSTSTRSRVCVIVSMKVCACTRMCVFVRVCGWLCKCVYAFVSICVW